MNPSSVPIKSRLELIARHKRDNGESTSILDELESALGGNSDEGVSCTFQIHITFSIPMPKTPLTLQMLVYSVNMNVYKMAAILKLFPITTSPSITHLSTTSICWLEARLGDLYSTYIGAGKSRKYQPDTSSMFMTCLNFVSNREKVMLGLSYQYLY